MKEAIRKEILYDLDRAINILEVREAKDIEELKALSDHAIEDVALEKDLDVISITVLLYSLYKIITTIKDEDYRQLLQEFKNASKALQAMSFPGYNKSIKRLFQIVQRSNAATKQHLQDVMQAARIKKGTALLERGLSIGQAAGLMGLSNWDLQEYAAKTTTLEQHRESFPAEKRLQKALSIFGV